MSNDVVLKVAEWFSTGNVGISSKAMATWLGLKKHPRDCGHPRDPDDLDRCLQLLEAVPELRADLLAMRGLSPQWEALVERWEEIERSHIDEVGLRWAKGRRADRTYKLMCSILKAVPVKGEIRISDRITIVTQP